MGGKEEMGYENKGITACQVQNPLKIGEEITQGLGAAIDELGDINSRLCGIEIKLLPPLPANACSKEQSPSPSALMVSIVSGIKKLRDGMVYTREVISRLENEI